MLTPLNLTIAIALVLFFVYLIAKPTSKLEITEEIEYEYYVDDGADDPSYQSQWQTEGKDYYV